MFEGVLTALVTPLRDGAVDERALQELVELQIGAGVDGLVPCGSTGEAATLSHAEHRRVVEVVVAAARGRVKVLAGTGSNSTSEAIELTRHAKEAGADGALLISPYYNKPMPEGIVGHFQAIARETSFPLVVYNIPGRTASNIQPETMARLAEIDQVVGTKESSGDLHQVAQTIQATPDDFAVLAGDDWATLPMLAIGGKGIISTVSNVAASDVVELVRSFRAGELDRSRDTHYRLLPLIDAVFCETNPIPIKAALALRGLIQEELRLPLTPLSPPNRERLQVALKEFGIL
ncbi:MAG: 4-hydroxy-tetrahydrodipicolinate synthase [Myxococcota bacterium]|nr:4-hydroxy-tetrahydrodipicolinate synthase [Myxococcota bacterium]